MAAGSVPRNFKLLDELEDAERSQEGMADISLGLVTLEDTLMNNWQGTIVQAAGGGSDVRVWFLSLVAGPDYPTQCPTIKFTSKINMTGVDSKGNVDPSKIAYLKDWQPSNTLKGALTAIKAAIGSAPRSQPEDGETY